MGDEHRVNRVFDAVVASSSRASLSNASSNDRVTPASSSAAAGFGGGFLPEDGDDSGAGGGGFLPEDNNEGGFMPVDAEDEDKGLRMPLSRVSRALKQLAIPQKAEVRQVFEDAASSDEEAGEKTVSRERFVQICSVLMPQSSDDEDSQEDEEEDDGSPEGSVDEYRDDEESARPSTSAPKRATRNRTRKDPSLLVEPAKLSGDEEDEDSDGSQVSSSKRKTSATTTTKKKRKRKDDLDLDKQGMRQAFDLFFSAGLGKRPTSTDGKTIGLGELRNVAAVLKEKLTDDEVRSPYLDERVD